MTRIALCLLGFLWSSCADLPSPTPIATVDWGLRSVVGPLEGPLESGSTYLSVYSQIYSRTEQATHDLSVTVSLRNTDRVDTLFVESAEYFNTKGELLRSYFDVPIYVAPMETVEIVIPEADRTGGTGANFVFDWKMRSGSSEPLFEGVMISAIGHQGLSFTTTGVGISRR